jgi:hypothetical protein
MGQQLKLTSMEEGTQFQTTPYLGRKTRAIADLLRTQLGGRSQFARGIQRRVSEQTPITTSAGVPLTAEEQATLQAISNLGNYSCWSAK